MTSRIYFIGLAPGQGADFIKIGFSTDVPSRLASLQTASPFALEVRAQVDGTQRQERWLHAHLVESRHRFEWYRPTDSVLAIVREAQETGAVAAIPSLPAVLYDNFVARLVEMHGGPSKFARAVGHSPAGVYHWIKAGRIPAERVASVEKGIGISRKVLRPDMYPPQTIRRITFPASVSA